MGAYRDNNGKPWVLPSVKQVSHHRLRGEENEAVLRGKLRVPEVHLVRAAWTARRIARASTCLHREPSGRMRELSMRAKPLVMLRAAVRASLWLALPLC